MRGNATLMVLFVLAAMTTTSLQLWRLWAMQSVLLQQREQWQEQWMGMTCAFDACCWTLKKDFDYYASRMLQNKNTIISLPAIPEDFGTVSAVMSLAKDAFMVELTRQTDTQQRVRFLVEKQRDDNGQTELLVHHVTFGASI
jgi:hypothetical protein